MSQNKPTGLPEPEAKPPTTAQGKGATTVGLRGVNVGGNVDGDIITGDVIHYYLTGTHTTFFQLTVGIENFLTTYLGSPGKPVPFGGRTRELAWLNNWLDHGRQQRLLLVAPAGRGKSALLARWSAQLIHQEDLAVVFMPISVRFNTNREDNTFVVLATRLAHFYGKQIPTDYANFTPQMWRGLVAEYLKEPLPDGRRLLLILDSLDEAAWQVAGDLLPLNLPVATRVVVSARYLGGEEQTPQPWLRRLEWIGRAETLELEVLDPAGVRDVLEKMGCPLDELGRSVDIVAELHRLSQGDPLLVELYVQDLWQRGEEAAHLRPEDLHSIQPGYQGYFDRWWQEQKRLWDREKPVQEKLLRGILTLLSLAHGPLTVADLQELLQSSLEADSWLLREAVAHLSRFMIGDGQAQGYVFSHPKLADYFREQLSRWEQMTGWQQFLAWGERTLEAVCTEQVRPLEVSSYLMQYYGRHLEEAQASVEALLALVSQEWLQVWHEKTGTYAGFLQDVEQIWARLQAENATSAANAQKAPYMGQEILCALCQASVNSLADNIPDELLVLLLRERLWTAEQVIAYVRQRPEPEKRSLGFIQVVPHLPAESQPALWLEAIVAAWELRDEGRRAQVLAALAPHQPEEVLAAARQLQDEWNRAQVLAALAPHQPEEVLAAARQLQDEGRRAQVLAAVAPHLMEAERSAVLDEALAAAWELQYEWRRAEVLAALAPHRPGEVLAAARQLQGDILGERARVLAALAPHRPGEVLATEEELQDERSRFWVLAALAPHRPGEVLAAARQLQDERSRAQVLAALAPHQPGEVLAAARELRDEESRAQVLAALAPHQPGEVLAAARELQYERSRAQVLTALVPHLIGAERLAVVVEALAVARELRDERSRAQVLTALAPHLIGAERLAVVVEALAAAWELRDERSRAQVLTALAPHQPGEVLSAARDLQYEWSRAEVLAALAPHQPGEVLAVARELRDEASRSQVLVALAPHLMGAERPVVLDEAMAAARELQGDIFGSRFWVLAALAPHRPGEVLAAARELWDERSRAQVLAALAPHQPGEVLAAARELWDERSRAQVLAALAPHQPGEVLAAARELQHEESRSQVLAELAPHLMEAERPVVLDEAMAAARELQDEESRAEVLAALALHRPAQVLAAARELQDEESCAEVLAALAPHQPGEVLAAARDLQYEWGRAEVLAALAPHQPGEVLAAARELQHEESRSQVLAELAPHLMEAERPVVLDEAMAAARELQDEESRAEVLAALAPHRPAQVLAAARELQDERRRAEVLDAVVLHLVQAEHPAVLYTLWQETLPLLSQRTRPDLLSDIATLMPVIHKLGGDKGVADTLDAVQKVCAWWP